jgi:putative endonuclease
MNHQLSRLAQSQLGKQGEDAVARYLEKHRYRILGRNVSCRTGEIDLVASKEDVIAFVEVKTRHEHQFELSQIIVPAKQHKIIAAARWYIAQHALCDMVYRFDVALVQAKYEDFVITYIPNAFTDEESVV